MHSLQQKKQQHWRPNTEEYNSLVSGYIVCHYILGTCTTGLYFSFTLSNYAHSVFSTMMDY